MAKIQQSRKLPPEKRRQQLLQAATKLFIKRGYRGTSTEEIARRARLTKGALYHHFKSKEEILLALLEGSMQRYQRVMEEVAARENISPIDVLSGLLSVHDSEDFSDFRQTMDIWVQGLQMTSITDQLCRQGEEMAERLAKVMDVRFGRTLAARMDFVKLAFSYYDGLASRKCMFPESVNIADQKKLFSKLVLGFDATKAKRGKVE